MKVKIIEIGEGRVNLEDGNGVSQWVNLAEWVKPNFVKLGDAEVTIKEDQVTFLKMSEAPKTFGKTQKSFGGNFGGTGAPPPQSSGYPKASPPEEKKFYKTKHLVLENMTAEELKTQLDVASEQNWVIATQTHFVGGKWNAVIYYKVKPE